MAYLDHNATSPLRDEARIAMEHALAIGGNPSSVHTFGRNARALIEDARKAIAALIGAQSKDLVFTSGGTEANATALHGAVHGAAESGARITRLFVSAIEHDSVLANAARLGEWTAGLRVEVVPVTADGLIEIEGLAMSLREGKGRALVVVMAANNETGVVQPLDRILPLVKECAALLMVDAIQAAGKVDLDFDALGADYMTLSAHKLGGPQGVGALAVKENAPFTALLAGGGQERGLRAGTENVAGIAGFGAAAKAARTEDIGARLKALRDRFERELLRLAPDAVVFGTESPRLPNTSNFAVPGVPAETALMALDLDGVMMSSGSACSSGRVAPSHVLGAMGVAEALARSALRASFGWNSNETDVDQALASLTALRARILARAA